MYLIEQELRIDERIYSVRGMQVMIDRDLAELYEVETKALNQAVKRNIDRFPPSFMFRLEREEFMELVTICDRFEKLKHSSNMPHAFTEQGLAMLSGLLNSDIAIQVNINIMRAFVAVRQMIALPPSQTFAELKKDVADLKIYIEDILADQNDINEETAMQLELINQSLAELQMNKQKEDRPRKPIGFIQPE